MIELFWFNAAIESISAALVLAIIYLFLKKRANLVTIGAFALFFVSEIFFVFNGMKSGTVLWFAAYATRIVGVSALIIGMLWAKK